MNLTLNRFKRIFFGENFSRISSGRELLSVTQPPMIAVDTIGGLRKIGPSISGRLRLRRTNQGRFNCSKKQRCEATRWTAKNLRRRAIAVGPRTAKNLRRRTIAVGPRRTGKPTKRVIGKAICISRGSLLAQSRTHSLDLHRLNNLGNFETEQTNDRLQNDRDRRFRGEIGLLLHSFFYLMNQK
jgi:hypothetical protein